MSVVEVTPIDVNYCNSLCRNFGSVIEMSKPVVLLAGCYGSSLCCVRRCWRRDKTINPEFWEHHAG